MPKRPEGVPWPLAALIVVGNILRSWISMIFTWYKKPRQEDKLRTALQNANTFPEWRRAAFALDHRKEAYNWRVNSVDKSYDYLRLEERRQMLYRLRMKGDAVAVAELLRTGFLRNLFGITKLSLFRKTYITTKDCIQAYIEETIACIRFVVESPPTITSRAGRLSAQDKLELLENGQRMVGSTALVMEGGSVFGLCHLGVMKALFEHNLLPRVIVGTATGAVMAALMSVQTTEDLPAFLSGRTIDLSAFSESSLRAREKRMAEHQSFLHNWTATLWRRTSRILNTGFVLDPEVLAECIYANIGDTTFQEAFDKTGRVLNIIVTSPSDDIPNLLNYLTASTWLIRSAAMASHLTNLDPNSEIQLLKKDAHGNLVPIPVRPASSHIGRARPRSDHPPLSRLRQQFNIDHFLVSQARPYLAPFTLPSLPSIRPADAPKSYLPKFLLPSVPFVANTLLSALSSLNILPNSISRVRSDQSFPADTLTFVPEFGALDVKDLVMKNPTREDLVAWIGRGEKAVWPSLCAVQVRCAVEKALEGGLEAARRRGGRPGGGSGESGMRARGGGSRGGAFDWGQE
ncbi:uncharacterized protein MYCGRDRAFT_107785 [Zymoseptoria tritici IPO323]|uniref:PNPLA domain-containing protein n=1 Tax=Zymoseptoria tritici (strain CBS 115943 / IPO323) TaxID=336722 RepID=F9X1L9_ZYMTI|nr:uncharacterized protein MYCGRDRAFT_107785 [Zymoseptoria tritici IPO323]EGP91800.1 hypothetical protein MYCGRDRAFT_107785 [Zymoseptoria tritici IPO323]